MIFTIPTCMITNFLPKSTLLMMVSAFLWTEFNEKKHTKKQSKSLTKFYSYGDAMLII
jgi:S-adenosylmethionine:tRNA-ribosyltransferase-isomerase (queuine synthetase)